MSEIIYDNVEQEKVSAQLMKNVYWWMALALAVTGLTAYFVGHSTTLLTLVFNNTWVFYGSLILELVLVFVLAASIERISFQVAMVMFIAYSMLNGLTMSFIFLIYTETSIASTFFITAATYIALALYGTFTKRDLSWVGKVAMFALIGLIIATLFEIFFGNTQSLIIDAIGVLVFAGLTAYDAQKIKQRFANELDVNESTMKLALIGALDMYLDFINMFLYLLSFFGKKK